MISLARRMSFRMLMIGLVEQDWVGWWWLLGVSILIGLFGLVE